MPGIDIGPFQRIVRVSWTAGNLLIRYIWTASAGRDLDTVTSVSIGGTSLGGKVGWGYGYAAYGYLPGTVQLVEFLRWQSGDNISQGGEECVLVNVDNLLRFRAMSGDPQRLISVSCAAHWFGSPQSGEVTLRVDSPDNPGLDPLSKPVTVTTRYNDPQLLASVLVTGGQPSFQE